MKRIALCVATTLGLIATSQAADLPNRYRGPDMFSPSPVATWTGFYVGAQAGYAWGSDQTRIDVPGFPFSFVGPDHDTSGAVGGLHAGYNFQTGLAVFGVEGDLELAGIDGKVQLSGSGGFPGYDLSSRTSINAQGSLRGRIGFAMLDQLMLYGTAGLAFANVENAYTATLPPGNVFGTPAGISSAKFDDMRWGWTVGAGLEYAVMRNWVTRVEYRYTNLSEYKTTPAFLAAGGVSEHNPDFHTVRVGASYRF
jgi:outer membrane immunogenic protein